MSKLNRINGGMNDLTRAIIIATIASLAADWLRRKFADKGE